jgi:hypothetical protein
MDFDIQGRPCEQRMLGGQWGKVYRCTTSFCYLGTVKARGKSWPSHGGSLMRSLHPFSWFYKVLPPGESFKRPDPPTSDKPLKFRVLVERLLAPYVVEKSNLLLRDYYYSKIAVTMDNTKKATTSEFIPEKQSSTTHSLEATDVQSEVSVDYAGASRKTDPAEIALVRKLDLYMMVSLQRPKSLRYLL